MTLKNAAFFAFIGMALLTVVCALGFIGDMSALLAGAIAPMMVLKSLIHFVASLSVAIFLYVFRRSGRRPRRNVAATIETSSPYPA